jgi:hypothetical protein
LGRLAPQSAAVASGVHGELRFDPRAFSLSDNDGDPRIIPMAAAPDAAGQLASLALPTIDVPPPHPSWWRAAREQLPRVSADGTTLIWSPTGYSVIARATDTGDRLEFSLAHAKRESGREQRIGTFPGPAWSVLALDAMPTDAPLRRALMRAFDDAQGYGDPARQFAVVDRASRTTLIVRPAGSLSPWPRRAGRRPPLVSRSRARRGS